MTIGSVIKTVAGVFAGLLIVAGVGLKWGLFPMIVNSMILDTLKLSPENDDIYDTWVEPTTEQPVYMKFTFFNVTNPDGIKSGDTPEVAELGPFVYRESRHKEGISFVEDTVSFGSYISYTLDEEISCSECKKDTKITVINPALVGVLSMLDGIIEVLGPDGIEVGGVTYTTEMIIFLLLDTLNTAISAEDGEFEDDLFTTETADKMIYAGYRPGSLNFVLDLLDTVTDFLEASGMSNLTDLIPPIPDQIADGSFAFFKGANGTADNGWYKVNTGLYDMSKYQKILEYNGGNKLPESWWGTLAITPSANRTGVKGKCLDLAGTDGTQYAPFVDQDQDLWLFSSDLCRSIYLSYFQEIDMDGVKTMQYRVTPEVLSFSNPENACFCPNVEKCVKVDEETDTWDLSECTHCNDGMLNLIGCQGAPVIISLPHFLNAKQEFVDNVIGLRPDEALHTTYLNVEPYTGLALAAHKRIQVNVHMQPNPYLTVLQNVKEVTFPILWVDETSTVQGENLDELKKKLVTPFLGIDIGVGFMIGLGGVILLVLAVLSIFCGSKN